MSDSEDDISLSASTLAALREFQTEQQDRQAQFSKLYEQADTDFRAKSIEDFQEDWNLSQFWYSDSTQKLLARELIDNATEETRIIIISAPSVYAALLKVCTNPAILDNIYLMEFDDRFKLLAKPGRFIHYDFNRPLDVPKELKGTFDRALIDPPFLSDECQSKAAITARFLLKPQPAVTRTLVCTGERMRDLIAKVYPSTRLTTFHPEHGNGLSNEFRCYASYESDSNNWKWES